jgi:hypothetical protein
VTISNVTRFKLTAEFDPANRYQLETSSNFQNWTPLGDSFQSNTGSQSADLPTNGPAAFIRLKQLP